MRPGTDRRTLPRPPSWQDDAACAGLDPALWDTDLPDRWRTGQAICWGSCPVRVECLTAALDDERGDRYAARGHRGMVWGGLTPAQRATRPDATASDVLDWDDPPGQPESGTREHHALRRVHVDDVEWLIDAGLGWGQIMDRLGVGQKAVDKALRRGRRQDLIDRLTQRSLRPSTAAVARKAMR